MLEFGAEGLLEFGAEGLLEFGAELALLSGMLQRDEQGVHGLVRRLKDLDTPFCPPPYPTPAVTSQRAL